MWKQCASICLFFSIACNQQTVPLEHKVAKQELLELPVQLQAEEQHHVAHVNEEEEIRALMQQIEEEIRAQAPSAVEVEPEP